MNIDTVRVGYKYNTHIQECESMQWEGEEEVFLKQNEWLTVLKLLLFK